MSRWRGLLLLLATVGGVLLTARLGIWQLDRAAQKEALQTAIVQRAAEPVLQGDAITRATADDAASLEHRRARVEGTWLAELTVHLDNRQMDGRPGFYVLTPMSLADGTALLVQRGWRARDFEDRTRLEPLKTPAGTVTLEGRLARGVARLYAFEGADIGPIRQNLDLSAYATETGLRLRPFLLLQTSPADDGLLRDWPLPAVDVHKHYGYAFQWFALCALILCLHVWFRILRPRRQRRA